MKCICGGESKVYRVIHLGDGNIRRHRICLLCGMRWTTIEKVKQ